MRIGIMLRHLGQHGGGVLVYTENLLRELLALETRHEFLLLHNDARFLGKYGGRRTRDLSLPGRSMLVWDQWTVRRAVRRERIDLVFNPKYSIPLGIQCRTVFVCHGLDWYVMPSGSLLRDRLSHRFLIPLYARAADRIIAVSNTARRHLAEYLDVEERRSATVYLGVDESFRRPIPPERLATVRRRYRLPERFFLYVGQIYPPKNFGRLLRAFAEVGPGAGIPLVVAGSHTWLAGNELALVEELGLDPWVHRPGWIGREDLPAFYALAEALVLPSLYEACPLPTLEAMASGCPVVTADRHGTAELVGDAGVLVNPESVEGISSGMRSVVSQDPAERDHLIALGRKRASAFTWRRCAEETLRELERAGGESGGELT